MGRTGAGETWPVRTQAGAWDDCYDEPYKHKDYSRHLYGPDYGLHAIGCDYRSRTQGMTLPRHTAEVELTVQWMEKICHREMRDASFSLPLLIALTIDYRYHT